MSDLNAFDRYLETRTAADSLTRTLLDTEQQIRVKQGDLAGYAQRITETTAALRELTRLKDEFQAIIDKVTNSTDGRSH